MIKLQHGSLDSLIASVVTYEKNNGIFETLDGCKVTSNFMNIFCPNVSVDHLITLDTITKTKSFQRTLTFITSGMKMTYNEESMYSGSCIICETVFEASYWYSRYTLLTKKKVLVIKSRRKTIPDADVVICPRLYVNVLVHLKFYRVVYTNPWLKTIGSSNISSLFSYALTHRNDDMNDVQCFRLEMWHLAKPRITHLYYVSNKPFIGNEWNFPQQQSLSSTLLCSNCLHYNKATLKLACSHLVCKKCLIFKITNCKNIALESCHVCKHLIYKTNIVRLVYNQKPETKTLTDVKKIVLEKFLGKTVFFDLDTPNTKVWTQKMILTMSSGSSNAQYFFSPFAELPPYVHYEDVENVVINQTFQPTAAYVQKIMNLFCYNRSQPVNLVVLFSKKSFLKKWKTLID